MRFRHMGWVLLATAGCNAVLGNEDGILGVPGGVAGSSASGSAGVSGGGAAGKAASGASGAPGGSSGSGGMAAGGAAGESGAGGTTAGSAGSAGDAGAAGLGGAGAAGTAGIAGAAGTAGTAGIAGAAGTAGASGTAGAAGASGTAGAAPVTYNCKAAPVIDLVKDGAPIEDGVRVLGSPSSALVIARSKGADLFAYPAVAGASPAPIGPYSVLDVLTNDTTHVLLLEGSVGGIQTLEVVKVGADGAVTSKGIIVEKLPRVVTKGRVVPDETGGYYVAYLTDDMAGMKQLYAAHANPSNGEVIDGSALLPTAKADGLQGIAYSNSGGNGLWVYYSPDSTSARAIQLDTPSLSFTKKTRDFAPVGANTIRLAAVVQSDLDTTLLRKTTVFQGDLETTGAYFNVRAKQFGNAFLDTYDPNTYTTVQPFVPDANPKGVYAFGVFPLFTYTTNTQFGYAWYAPGGTLASQLAFSLVGIGTIGQTTAAFSVAAPTGGEANLDVIVAWTEHGSVTKESLYAVRVGCTKN